MNWHRKRRIITALFAAGIALLIAMAVVSVNLDARAVERNAELSKIRDRSEAATKLLAALIDIETGVRGYLITGDPSYLAPLYRGRDVVTDLRSTMGAEFDAWTSPGYSDLPLALLMEKRAKINDDLLETARMLGITVAREQLRNGESKMLMDRMRAVLSYQMSTFAQESDATQRSADSLATLHSVLTVSALGLAILFSIVQFILFRGEVNGRGAVEQTLRQRNEDRRQVAEMSGALQLADSRREAFNVIAAFSRKIMPEVSGAFYVYTASRDQLTRVAQWNHPGHEQKFAEHLQPTDCWGLRQGGRHTGCIDALDGKETDASPIDCRHLVTEDRIGPYTCIPIVGRGQILGMLHLRGEVLRTRTTSAALDDSIERFTDQLSLSLTNIELREKLENMALRDGLTGLYNRRFLDEVLEHNLAKLKRESKHAGLLLLDVDHFKRFNDTHGHQAGDEALRRVGATLTAAVRASDVVCRYGGEEFLVFLPECEIEEATAKAEAIRIAIATTALTVDNQPIPPVTASIGLAMFPGTGTTRGQLIQMADRALYRAKGAGRNRVMVAEPVGLVPSDFRAGAQAAK
jgi:diguanylate cyclase (GGDEF)-like protein